MRAPSRLRPEAVVASSSAGLGPAASSRSLIFYHRTSTVVFKLYGHEPPPLRKSWRDKTLLRVSRHSYLESRLQHEFTGTGGSIGYPPTAANFPLRLQQPMVNLLILSPSWHKFCTEQRVINAYQTLPMLPFAQLSCWILPHATSWSIVKEPGSHEHSASFSSVLFV